MSEGSPIWHQEEAEPIPSMEKLAPPSKVQVKFLVRTNGMIITSESAQWVNYATEECMALGGQSCMHDGGGQ